MSNSLTQIKKRNEKVNQELIRIKLRLIDLSSGSEQVFPSPSPGGVWHVHYIPEKLTSSLLYTIQDPILSYKVVIDWICVISELWIELWADEPEMSSFLNSSSLIKELEEAIVTLTALLRNIRRKHFSFSCLVDVCSGKGFLAMVLAFLSLYIPELSQLSEVLMVDRRFSQMNLVHLKYANRFFQSCKAKIRIRIWSCNIFEQEFPERLQRVEGNLVMIGIHLCRRLSPRFLQVYSDISNCKYSLLGPCCLPPPVASPIVINNFKIFPLDIHQASDPYQLWVQKLSELAAWNNSQVRTFTTKLRGGPHRCNIFIESLLKENVNIP